MFTFSAKFLNLNFNNLFVWRDIAMKRVSFCCILHALGVVVYQRILWYKKISDRPVTNTWLNLQPLTSLTAVSRALQTSVCFYFEFVFIVIRILFKCMHLYIGTFMSSMVLVQIVRNFNRYSNKHNIVV